MSSVLLRKARSARFHLTRHMRTARTRTLWGKAFALTKPRRAPATPAAEPVGELRRQGFAMIRGGWSEADLRRVAEQLSVLPCNDPWHPEFGQFDFVDAPAASNNIRVVGANKIPEVLRIANDPHVLDVVAGYLGCKPTIDDVLAWWSLPGRPGPLEEQFFHRDNDSIRFLKLFVYLSDVDDKSGPHVFVQGTHASNDLLELGRRWQDAEVAAAGLGDRIRQFVGPFGTSFLEDTYGLHKGQLPEDRPRLVLQVRYTLFPSIFARASERSLEVGGFDPYINRVMAGR